MKKRGFTLIELLAVIVVLAIIALIATPIVMNTIKNAQKGAAERSAERYIDAVELAIASDRLKNGPLADGTYTVNADGNLVLGAKVLTVDVSGDIPAEGSKVAIKNGQVVPNLEGEITKVTIKGYDATINSKGNATATEPTKENEGENPGEENPGGENAGGDPEPLCTAIAPSEQQIVLVNPTSGPYMASQDVGVQATSGDPHAPGAVYSCDLGDGARTFYVIEVEGSNVKLIMSENLGETIAWESEENINNVLVSRTTAWTKLTAVGGTKSLPSAQDIADAIGAADWTSNDADSTGISLTWLKTGLGAMNPPYGYWTTTHHPVVESGRIWFVDGLSLNNTTDSSSSNGIRPIITVPADALTIGS